MKTLNTTDIVSESMLLRSVSDEIDGHIVNNVTTEKRVMYIIRLFFFFFSAPL